MPGIPIVIVEDDEIAAEILQKQILYLEPKCEPEWYWNGFEALVRLQERPVRAVFLDYMMPEFDGRDFLRSARSLNTTGETVVVVISAYVDDFNAREFKELGADFVFSKPVTIEQLAKVLDLVKQSPTEPTAP